MKSPNGFDDALFDPKTFDLSITLTRTDGT